MRNVCMHDHRFQENLRRSRTVCTFLGDASEDSCLQSFPRINLPLPSDIAELIKPYDRYHPLQLSSLLFSCVSAQRASHISEDGPSSALGSSVRVNEQEATGVSSDATRENLGKASESASRFLIASSSANVDATCRFR